jgi:uncharacterized membrane protein
MIGLIAYLIALIIALIVLVICGYVILAIICIPLAIFGEADKHLSCKTKKEKLIGISLIFLGLFILFCYFFVGLVFLG